jgi:hypothetical protein
MKKSLLTLSLLFYSITVFCQLKYKQDLKGIAQINFPDTPKVKVLADGVSVYVFNGDGIIYMAQVSPVGRSVKDMLTDSSLDSIYSYFVTGSLKGTKGKLLYKKNASIRKLDGVEFSYKANISGQNLTAYNQAVFLNDTLLNYVILSPDPMKKDDKKVRSFFDSFKLKISADDARQDGGSALAYESGKVLGKIIFVFVLLLIIGGIVYLITKAVGRKRKKEWSEEDFK